MADGNRPPSSIPSGFIKGLYMSPRRWSLKMIISLVDNGTQDIQNVCPLVWC